MSAYLTPQQVLVPKRVLGQVSEELVPSSTAEIPDGWLDAVCFDRGQTGADALAWWDAMHDEGAHVAWGLWREGRP